MAPAEVEVPALGSEFTGHHRLPRVPRNFKLTNTWDTLGWPKSSLGFPVRLYLLYVFLQSTLAGDVEASQLVSHGAYKVSF